MKFKQYLNENKFKVGDIIVPIYSSIHNDMRRKILKVSKTEYTIKFLVGKKNIVKWPISGVDGDHIKLKE